MVWLDSFRLRSGSPQTRRKAIERLTAAGKLRSLKLLIGSLEDQDPEVRYAAAEALSTISKELSVAARLAARADLSATAALKEVQDPQRIGPLPKSAREAHSKVRRGAVASVGQESSEPVRAMMRKKPGDPAARARRTAGQEVEQQAVPAHLTHFVALLADEDFEVRLKAIQCLRRLGDPVVAQALVARLADSDSDVRLAAALALGAIRNPVALESLVLSLADEEPAVRHAAAAALEQIDPRWVRTEAAQRAMPRLEALRADLRPWIVTAAEKVIEKLRAAKDKDTEVWKRESGIRNL